MRISFLIMLIGCLSFMACNHSPKNDEQTSRSDTLGIPIDSNHRHPIMLKEPIVKSIKHYFSDTLTMDSFVLEIPVGNLISHNILVKIYNHQNALLFLDSVRANPYEGYIPTPDENISYARNRVMTMFNVDNFTRTGEEQAIKNASANQITNMVGWNEAIADSDRIVFNFINYNLDSAYVVYSEKLKRAAVIVKVPTIDDRP